MAVKTPKKWYKSKTIIASILLVLVQAYAGLDAGVFADALPNVPEFVTGILLAMGAVGLRTADKPIG